MPEFGAWLVKSQVVVTERQAVNTEHTVAPQDLDKTFSFTFRGHASIIKISNSMKVSHRISSNGSVKQEPKAPSKFKPNNASPLCNFLTKDLSHFTSYLHIPFTRTGSPQVNNSLFHRLLGKEDDKM